MKLTTFYRFEDLDARIGIRVDADHIQFAFLAKGNAYKGTGSDRKLYARNPDRTKAIDRLMLVLSAPKVNEACVGIRFGRSDNEAILPATGGITVRQAYSKGGNYRFDFVAVRSLIDDVRLGPDSVILVDAVAVGLGLVPCDNRPVPVAF